MTPAQRQANYRKRQEEKMRRYEEALGIIASFPLGISVKDDLIDAVTKLRRSCLKMRDVADQALYPIEVV